MPVSAHQAGAPRTSCLRNDPRLPALLYIKIQSPPLLRLLRLPLPPPLLLLLPLPLLLPLLPPPPLLLLLLLLLCHPSHTLEILVGIDGCQVGMCNM